MSPSLTFAFVKMSNFTANTVLITQIFLVITEKQWEPDFSCTS